MPERAALAALACLLLAACPPGLLASTVEAQDIPRPAWVRSGEVNDDGAVVFSAPDERSSRRGTVALGTRFAPGKTVKGVGCGDFRFVQLGDEAFVCEHDLTWSKLEPGGVTQPLMAAGAILPHDYLFVTGDGIGAYSRTSDVEAGDFAIVLNQDFGIVVGERVSQDGVAFVRSAHGYYVPQSELRARAVSQFAGVRIEDGKLDGIAWVIRDGALRRSSPEQKQGKKLARLSLVRVEGPEARGALRLQDGGYVRARDVASPRPLAAMPEGLLPGERFVDVDVDRQVVVVYEGTRPIFATLASTGLPTAETPRGSFRIWAKLTSSDMNDTELLDVERNYSIESVPWVQYFHESIALHTAFWHDRFGEKHSHGCVNLSPRDARTVFELTQPTLPVGYYAILPTEKTPGGRVLVR